ncbi:hypothetical protein [Stutzerimonas nitrititolerans]|uniref:hypothetical protein n=1 Tax=Stutzerimonas nitrititolerans TaxID=2482751 RepID=UPI0028A7F30A|nr:hypothetical protein [Stutzerimonas nitrititolerans]
MTGTSTTPPYSGATTSSTPIPPQNYVLTTSTSLPTSNNSSSFNFNDWGILLVSMALTGIIGFFSSLIAVKADIAENKKDISVTLERIKHNQLETSNIKDVLKNLNSVDSRISVLDAKIQNLEKTVDRQSIPQPAK